ncbi:pilus assembly protein [Pseudoalteromonas sp. SSDWG2]|uniref:pilus assembly protein n=1 Tax=Pseudoalteromonas sp. SSDWG2 TaxID=3139391 RepID=UPI003BAD61C3
MKVLNKLALAIALCSPAAIHAEDIEVYVGQKAAVGAKAKVLFILDNSNSMNEGVLAPEPYNNTTEYGTDGADSGFKDDYIFYSVGQTIDDIVLAELDNRSDAKRFNFSLNGCDAAKEALAKYGFFTGKMLEFSGKKNTGEWINLKNDNGGNMQSAVDCLADFRNNDGDNQYLHPEPTKVTIDQYLQVAKSGSNIYSSQFNDELKGFPTTTKNPDHADFMGYSGESPGGEYDAEMRAKMEAIFEEATVVTLYSPHYVRWYIDKEANQTTQDKIEVAKETIQTTLGATPDADFALMVYNLNFPQENDRDGGRLVASFGNDGSIFDIVSSVSGQTNTPLCETLFEAYNYFAGNPVLYADDDKTCNSETGECGGVNYQGNDPAFDLSSTVNGEGVLYNSPYVDRGGCPQDISIVYITDGAPTIDNAADGAVKSLFTTVNYVTGQIEGVTPDTVPDPEALKGKEFAKDENGEVIVDENGEPKVIAESYLPALAHYMKKQDINKLIPGNQTATLYTVGFGGDAPEAILSKAAEEGGGRYYFADNGESLSEAISETLAEILATSTSFTAPSVASNNFDRTRTSDSVYYAMFLPTEGARWAGNLKKLKVSNGTVVDLNGQPALDQDGNIKSGTDIATTFWSAAPDGSDVRAGGANYVLSEVSASNRRVYSNIGIDGAITAFDARNIIDYYGSEADAGIALGVEKAEVKPLIAWARGMDVDDDNNDGQRTDTRLDVMGDPLHSRPVALSYPDGEIKVIMGTNAGFIHLFSDQYNTLTEQWSFIPEELFDNLSVLRNNTGGEKVYGMDSTATVHFIDANNNGIVDEGTDTVWVFFGMRRGGYSYYAIDISNSSTPKLMWHIDNTTIGFEEMGQSWSRPIITYLKGVVNSNNRPEPVLVFGAGYDTNKDLNYTADSVGRGVYLVRARNGSLVGKFTNELTNTLTGDVYFPGNHGIVGDIAVLDSNYDGLTDRMYATDTGGNVWRFDMPSADKSTWSTFKFADLGAITPVSENRRFYYGPSVSRTFSALVQSTEIDGETYISRIETPFEAITVGSGNRSHPLETEEGNFLYMLRDENVRTQTFEPVANPAPAPLTPSDLRDITQLPFDGLEGGSDAFVDQELIMGSYDGWMYSLPATEKSLSKPTVLFGVAYFTTFTPSEDNDLAKCVLKGGAGKLYAFNLHYGSTVYSSLSFDLGNKIPPAPTWVVEDQFYCLNCGTSTGTGWGAVDENGNPSPDGGLLQLIAVDESDPSKTTKPSFRTTQNYIYRLEE